MVIFISGSAASEKTPRQAIAVIIDLMFISTSGRGILLHIIYIIITGILQFGIEKYKKAVFCDICR